MDVYNIGTFEMVNLVQISNGYLENSSVSRLQINSRKQNYHPTCEKFTVSGIMKAPIFCRLYSGIWN